MWKETTPTLTKTKAQLEELGDPYIGIELLDGSKKFGRVEKFTPYNIYVDDPEDGVIDVPRRIIKRCILLIRGGKYDEQ
jgi:hypothetical protein